MWIVEKTRSSFITKDTSTLSPRKQKLFQLLSTLILAALKMKLEEY
ncbi:protein of unknown function [Brochothrix thermosphacta]|nr:protein of unknown function [Brochothrix thermosphacta]